MKTLLTGQPHCGKTTLLAKIVGLKTNKQGFLTEEILENGERVGFELVAANSAKVTFAHVDIESPYQVSKYFVNPPALDKFIEPLFTFSDNQLLYIDEIGRMELFSKKFKDLVRQYLDSPNNFVGTIANNYSDDFMEEIKSRNDITIIEITPENRDRLVTELRF